MDNIVYRKEKMGSYADMRDAFFEELYHVAEKDPNVIVLMADQDARTRAQAELIHGQMTEHSAALYEILNILYAH